MYRTVDNRPSWQLDAKWVSGVLLVVSLAVTLLFVGLAQVSRPEPAQAMLARVLEAELFPQGLEGGAPLVALETGVEYQPGQPFQLIPGVEVSVPDSELPGLDAAAAIERVAADLAGLMVSQGRGAALGRVSDPQLREQLGEAGRGTLQAIVRAHLGRAMLPSGLADGSRMANWPLQVQRNPGEAVQPIVGVFIRVEPATLRTLSESQIGLLVLDRLAEIVLEEGLNAARAQVSNPNLLTRLTEATQNEVRAALEAYLATLLVAEAPEIAARLGEVREAMSAQAPGAAPEDEVLAGLTSRQDLEGLSPVEANRRVLGDLATVIYSQGVTGAAELIPDETLRARVREAAGPLELYTAGEHDRFVGLGWLFGVLSLVLLALLVLFSRGLGRLLSAGLALMAAPLLGLLVFTPLWRRAEVFAASPLPERFSLAGVTGFMGSSLTYLPQSASASVVQTHLLVMAVGAGLVVLLLVAKVFGAVRARRRRF